MTHRHGYIGPKFGRTRDQRRALMKGLATSLVEHGSIETTLVKAKATVPYTEKLISKAKKGDLHNRRMIISALQTKEMAHKLVDEIAPLLTGRTSGHLRITKTGNRRGDNAPMARISFVDDISNVIAGGNSQTRAKSAALTSESQPTEKASKKVEAK
jgi:large subunit ribosomal protein L17